MAIKRMPKQVSEDTQIENAVIKLVSRKKDERKGKELIFYKRGSLQILKKHVSDLGNDHKDVYDLPLRQFQIQGKIECGIQSNPDDKGHFKKLTFQKFQVTFSFREMINVNGCGRVLPVLQSFDVKEI